MSEEQENPLSPTVSKVLDEYLATLEGDENINNEAAKRLNTLLRQGKIADSDVIARSVPI